MPDFSLLDGVFVVLTLLVCSARFIDHRLYRACAQQIFESMPWNQWLTYDEVRALTKYPQYYFSRSLMGLLMYNLLEVEIDPRVNEDEAYVERVRREPPVNQLLMVVMYRRTLRPRRKRKRKLWNLLPEAIGAPGLRPMSARSQHVAPVN